MSTIKIIESKRIQAGIAVDDGVAVHYKGRDISQIVSSRPNAKAYRVSFEKKVTETELETEFLGSF